VRKRAFICRAVSAGCLMSAFPESGHSGGRNPQL
ncbi:MAG: hypothetical protein ACI88G_002188, partial [Woeseiaceae bacterium]